MVVLILHARCTIVPLARPALVVWGAVWAPCWGAAGVILPRRPVIPRARLAVHWGARGVVVCGEETGDAGMVGCRAVGI